MTAITTTRTSSKIRTTTPTAISGVDSEKESARVGLTSVSETSVEPIGIKYSNCVCVCVCYGSDSTSYYCSMVP